LEVRVVDALSRAGLCLCAFAVIAPLVADAQRPTFSSRALGVRVDVLVTDGRRPVAGLIASDFELRDNGVVQSVEVLDAADVPLNAVLALDTSASIRGQRRHDLIAAGSELLDDLNPLDRVSLTTFSHAVAPRVPLTSDFATVRAELRRIEPEGQTAILDGAYTALAMTLMQPGRSLVIVCTDGSDTSSWLGPIEVVDAAKRSNAVLYGVTSADARRSTALSELADATGGQILQVKSSAELSATLGRILKEFRSRYILTYNPTNVVLGGFHTLDLRAKRRGLTVRARPGYIGLGSGS
jgi:VWFA-related protein